MEQDQIKCPCCGELVPAARIELAYKLPDDIASMDAEERDAQCKYSDDYVVCNDEYFYVRCVIPLPVVDSDINYSIGAWAQVSQNSFTNIWELWSDPDQVKEPPISALLANTIHLNTHTEDIEVQVQLTGPKSRPTILIRDSKSSLYSEQNHGITVHRASEYSDLCR